MTDQHDSSAELVPAEPIPDPGLEQHHPRPTDIDPSAEKRAERQVASFFLAAMVFSVLFVVAYFSFGIGDDIDTFLGMGASHVTLGASLGLALLCIGVGVIQWARKLMGDHEIVEYRHNIASTEEDREDAVGVLQQGLEESGMARRPLIRNTLIGAVALLGLPAIVSLRDLAKNPDVNLLRKTVWEKGMRVVQDVDGRPIRPADMQVGQLVNAEPNIFFENEDGENYKEKGGHTKLSHGEIQNEKAKAAVILVRMNPDDIKAEKSRDNWGVEGILCYSKICTHVGCPISLWEQQTHHLLCPCHQSTFDLADNGRVVFGPAARALPQLPLALDDEGYLVAQSDFTEPVGPSFWERG
jgi:ubiquinol-cytochrome c reductase iron-sulfur subunit